MDTTPNGVNVEQFAFHLLAEYEQLSVSEKRPGVRSDQPKATPTEPEKAKASKMKKLEEGSPSQKREEPRAEKGRCKFYSTEQGCRRGKSCQWSHDMKDEKRRCWNYGSTEHMAPACTRPKERGDGFPATSKGPED